MTCLQQTVPTASVPTAAVAAVVAQGNAARSTTSMRPADTSDYERVSMKCQDADAQGKVVNLTPKHPWMNEPEIQPGCFWIVSSRCSSKHGGAEPG
ncbi:hypothetical protein HPB52_016702 [Rhipicephalus sanguineus]|uniref:Uncharacterized protein n=1 Tax=Rhipicephalus sanguineus TaxID=34632 RepID=A0A9D4QB29_RHISA|nr:hypothetical protein HPB52_016702 [Rhipicephalus sanguineus]